MSSNTVRVIEIMRLLKVEMNGAVVGAMQECGVNYGLSYGVAAHTIKSAMVGYGTDQELAEALWRQDVRELKLAALYVADPKAFDADLLVAWGESVNTLEVAQHAARLFGQVIAHELGLTTHANTSIASILEVPMSWISDHAAHSDAVLCALGCYTIGHAANIMSHSNLMNTESGPITPIGEAYFGEAIAILSELLAGGSQSESHTEAKADRDLSVATGARYALSSIYATCKKLRSAIELINDVELQSILPYKMDEI